MKYLGVKIIDAEPMSVVEYNKKFDRNVPEDKGDGYTVVYEEGYRSWSPKEVFDKAYRPTNGLTFGLAIEAMKLGKRIARKGWDGKNMYAVLMPGYPDGIEVNEVTQKAHNLPDGTVLNYRPYYQLWTAQKDVAMWSPSTSDTLAEDWIILE